MVRIVTLIPNMMTLFRIFVVPLILACIYNDDYRLIGLCLFVIASVFDFLDGYVARLFNVQSTLGKVMDPIADKIIVILTLISLIDNGDISGPSVWAVLLIVMRELVISGAREFYASMGKYRSSGYISKVKTCAQMLAIAIIMFNGLDFLSDNWKYYFSISGEIMLWCSMVLSLVSGAIYLHRLYKD